MLNTLIYRLPQIKQDIGQMLIISVGVEAF